MIPEEKLYRLKAAQAVDKALAELRRMGESQGSEITGLLEGLNKLLRVEQINRSERTGLLKLSRLVNKTLAAGIEGPMKMLELGSTDEEALTAQVKWWLNLEESCLAGVRNSVQKYIHSTASRLDGLSQTTTAPEEVLVRKKMVDALDESIAELAKIPHVPNQKEYMDNLLEMRSTLRMSLTESSLSDFRSLNAQLNMRIVTDLHAAKQPYVQGLVSEEKLHQNLGEWEEVFHNNLRQLTNMTGEYARLVAERLEAEKAKS